MSAKSKAEELVLKYLRIDNNTKEWFNKHIAKQCALIAVDEIINVIEFIAESDEPNKLPFWEQVKKEIELL